MAIRFLRRLLPFFLLATASVVLALGASAARTTPAKTVPTCKTGQKSTNAHPCKPKAKTTTTAMASSSSSSSTGSTSSSTKSSTRSSNGGTAAPNPDGCPAGQQIAPGGDADVDNDGGPSDGDGCI